MHEVVVSDVVSMAVDLMAEAGVDVGVVMMADAATTSDAATLAAETPALVQSALAAPPLPLTPLELPTRTRRSRRRAVRTG